jgi:hypothetical protein
LNLPLRWLNCCLWCVFLTLCKCHYLWCLVNWAFAAHLRWIVINLTKFFQFAIEMNKLLPVIRFLTLCVFWWTHRQTWNKSCHFPLPAEFWLYVNSPDIFILLWQSKVRTHLGLLYCKNYMGSCILNSWYMHNCVLCCAQISSPCPVVLIIYPTRWIPRALLRVVKRKYRGQQTVQLLHSY